MHGFAKLNSETARLVRRQKAGSLPVLAPAGILRLREVIGQASWVIFPFVWVLLMKIQSGRFNYSVLSATIMWSVVAVIMAAPILAFVIYTGGIWQTIRSSVARFSAVVFWLYWPFWRLLAMVVAVALACSYGDHLWYNYFRLYEEYYRLQAYDNVDAYKVSGIRLQDAGLVVFNKTSGVDRSKAGCIVNGHTFCVAPIIHGGEVKPGAKQSESGVQDLFMAGIDCCNCPVTDFRCGAWDESVGKVGGMRLIDPEKNRMFRLAAEKWTADYQKVLSHGVFFEWANDPIVAWKQLWHHGFHLAVLYCIFGIGGSLLLMIVLNGLMRLLREFQIAAPIDEHPPMMPGLSLNGPVANKRDFIPSDYQNYLGQGEYREEQSTKFLIL